MRCDSIANLSMIMPLIEIQVVCFCGTKCVCVIHSSDGWKENSLVVQGGCPHFTKFYVSCCTNEGGFFYGGNAMIKPRVNAICVCGKQFEDSIREFKGWSQYARLLSSFFCDKCNHSLCYEILEPFNFASFAKKSLLDPANLILEVVGKNLAASVLQAFENAVPDDFSDVEQIISESKTDHVSQM